ncbi:capsule biosynthesis GfcC family protein [Halomonas sp. M5N1S17]|uniref:capsule biosynthesis GfcC family protein n=1 Tax=Halomonas alkalisoli TaxID=2907158 RepID=UPI001F2AF064|nr:capsule biosynthesis GfcC family protein [Halomonas alkalisoli]MCE9664983.1 capsule biosynthesis GfcC family protein [Halomonas alkalisoli]
MSVKMTVKVGAMRLRRPVLALMLTLLLWPTGASAQREAPVAAAMPGTLLEAWLTWQAEQPEPLDWAYSFALRSSDAATLDALHRELLAEITTLRDTLTLVGQQRQADQLQAWHQALQPLATAAARSPERLDLPWLAASLRRNLPTQRLVHLGTCEAPDWVELWSTSGVTRLAWQPGMTTADAIAQLPAGSRNELDQAALLSPLGDTTTLGVARWNRESLPLPPGARLVLLLPRHGLGGSLEGSLVNQLLVRFLATRLPGDACTLWPTR